MCPNPPRERIIKLLLSWLRAALSSEASCLTPGPARSCAPHDSCPFFTCECDGLQRLEKLEEKARVPPAEVAVLPASPVGKAQLRRPLGVLDGNATAADDMQPEAGARGTPLKAWRKAHPRRAAIAARAAIKGCATEGCAAEA